MNANHASSESNDKITLMLAAWRERASGYIEEANLLGNESKSRLLAVKLRSHAISIQQCAVELEAYCAVCGAEAKHDLQLGVGVTTPVCAECCADLGPKFSKTPDAKHQWMGGMTPSAPNDPPEGWCCCENCGLEKTDTDRDETPCPYDHNAYEAAKQNINANRP